MARWTADEDAELTRLAISGLARTNIAEQLDRTLASVEARASRLGITMAVASNGVPRASERIVLQRLQTETWLAFTKLSVPAGARLLQRLEAAGWIESRGHGPAFELKLTAAGLYALRAKIADGPPPGATLIAENDGL